MSETKEAKHKRRDHYLKLMVDLQEPYRLAGLSRLEVIITSCGGFVLLRVVVNLNHVEG